MLVAKWEVWLKLIFFKEAKLSIQTSFHFETHHPYIRSFTRNAQKVSIKLR